ncbi:MAG: acetyltransferase [Chromatiaceae bacterium]|nr:acetyltransferase [Chromatiaceae bacterium]
MLSELQLCEAVREACMRAALDAYESAGISGLCAEGRWGLAVQAIHILSLGGLLNSYYREAA